VKHPQFIGLVEPAVVPLVTRDCLNVPLVSIAVSASRGSPTTPSGPPPEARCESLPVLTWSHECSVDGDKSIAPACPRRYG
jgi:hypothetical protein